MDDKKRNSLKLDIEAARLTLESNTKPRESYKPIPEYLTNSELKDGEFANNHHHNNSNNMVRDKIDNIEDGADESMLNENEKDKLAANKEEVQFISGDQQNGNAKVNIGSVDKGFTGMTKEELMKYANDPFWIKIRWIFFILFWGLWIAMLVGAILIIVGAPKCSAPAPLSWYNQGPLVYLKAKLNIDEDLLKTYKGIGAKGIIYELPPDDTYRIVDNNRSAEIEEEIKKLVADFKRNDINVIVDVTPNYVTKDDPLFIQALADKEYRSAFVWTERSTLPTNWVSKVNDSAWTEITPENYVLSQFGKDRFDLQLSDKLAKQKFVKVLDALAKMGVKGFRVNNAKHFIINTDLKDEVTSFIPNTVHTDYDFWTHTQTTFQSGLGDLLYEFSRVVKNATNNEGFLSVTEPIERPEAFMTSSNKMAIELPVYGLLPHTLASTSTSTKAKQLLVELTEIVNALGNGSWPQWQYDLKTLQHSNNVDLSEYNTFLMLLPGVPVGPIQAFANGLNDTTASEYLKTLEEIRMTPSYMHGSFNAYTDANYSVIAYSRIKSGNPGYFVAYNPTDVGVSTNFGSVKGMPEQLTVHLFSKNYDVDKITEKIKVHSAAIPIAARSVIILTYVPKTTE